MKIIDWFIGLFVVVPEIERPAAKAVLSEIKALRAEVAALKWTKGGGADAPEPTTPVRGNVTPPPVGTVGGDWCRFPDEFPLERRHVLVRLTEIPCGDPSGLGGIPASVAAGYLRFAAGDKDSPYFVTHGISQQARTVTHWCDCLPDWMQVFDYAQQAEKYESSQPQPVGRVVHTGQPMYKCKRDGCETIWPEPRYCPGCENQRRAAFELERGHGREIGK